MLLMSAVNYVWLLYLRVNLVYRGSLFVVLLSLCSRLALQQVGGQNCMFRDINKILALLMCNTGFI